MERDACAPRSRRAVLAAAAGAAAATVAAAIEPAALARAGADGDVVLGGLNTATKMTSISRTTPGRALTVRGVSGNESADLWGGVAIQGSVVLSGAADDYLGIGVLGQGASFCTGVHGESYKGYGVMGMSETGTGTHGSSSTGTGVDAYSGRGKGVQAVSGMGTGVHAESQHGTALRTWGKVVLHRSGRASVGAGSRSTTVDLAPAGGLGGTPLCFANLMSYRSGVWVTAVRPNYPSSGKMRIYLNKVVTSRTYLAWLVLDAPTGVPPWLL